MKTIILLAILLGVSLFCTAACFADMAKDDAFLDQPFPKSIKLTMTSYPPPDGKGPNLKENMLDITSYAKGVELLGEIAEKKTILPDGLADWLKKNDSGTGMGSYGAVFQTKRTLFEMLCRNMGLAWHYDSKQDAIILDYAWKRTDPRSGKELADAVAEWQPVKKTNDEDMGSQEWHNAFDALLSRPENYPQASLLRLYHNSHGMFPGVNIFARKIREGDGPDEIIVLCKKMEIADKGAPGDVACYLFAADGKFLKGGIYSMGWYTGDVFGVKSDDAHTVTIEVGYGHFAMNDTKLHFALVKSDFVLQGSTDSKGQARNAEETRAGLPHAPVNVAKLVYSTADSGDD